MSISWVSLVITDTSGGDVSRLTSANGGEEFNFTFTFSEKIFQASGGHTYCGTLPHFFDGLAAYAPGPEGSTTLVWRGFRKAGPRAAFLRKRKVF